jgi:hypothetical protein
MHVIFNFCFAWLGGRQLNKLIYGLKLAKSQFKNQKSTPNLKNFMSPNLLFQARLRTNNTPLEVSKNGIC